jgi:hypothetical protein
MAPGNTAPATVAPNSTGMQIRGRVQAFIAMKMLEGAIQLLGSTSDEGQAALKALTILSKTFGKASGDITRQEVKLIGERTSPVDMPGPEQIGAFQSQIRANNADKGLGAPSSSAPPEMAGATPGGM